ncbi:hypothetical protein BLOT_016749 [Blomia tropicalis]|nr:hypothetical protein BLOT_016749 [Blomia tropicalis]
MTDRMHISSSQAFASPPISVPLIYNKVNWNAESLSKKYGISMPQIVRRCCGNNFFNSWHILVSLNAPESLHLPGNPELIFGN